MPSFPHLCVVGLLTCIHGATQTRCTAKLTTLVCLHSGAPKLVESWLVPLGSLLFRLDHALQWLADNLKRPSR